MFARLGRSVVAHPVIVILCWLVAVVGVIGMSTVILGKGGTASVTTDKQTDFIPSSNESVQAAKVAATAFPQPDGTTATIVFTHDGGGRLTTADRAKAQGVVSRLNAAHVAGVKTVTTSPGAISPNHEVMLGQVQFEKSAQDNVTLKAVQSLRTHTSALVHDSGLRAGYTGEAAAAKDSPPTEQLVSVGMIIMIMILLLVFFRSPVIAFFNVLIIALVGQGASMAIMGAAKLFHFTVDSTTTGLLPIVLFGVGTDYVVFLLFRYREHLRKGEDRKTAMAAAVARVGGAVSSSALAVVVSFSALSLSVFAPFRVLGPSLAFAVLVMFATGLTLVPAVSVLIGRAVFWPSKAWRKEPRAGLGDRVGRLVSRRPVLAAVAAIAVLGALALGSIGIKTSYEQGGMPKGTESARALDQLKAGFPAGTLDPVDIYLTGDHVSRHAAQGVLDAAKKSPIIGQAGGITFSPDRKVARIELYLTQGGQTTAAMNQVEHQVRPMVHAATPEGMRSYVGGTTSTFIDISHAMDKDRNLIFPVAGILIGLILLLMLRGLLAPAYLLGSVVLGFFATLGASRLVFQTIGHQNGLLFTLPLIVYLFVASIGTDYNILMIDRLRQELHAGRSRREAARLALRQTGPTVAAAGVILAGSFGVLTISPDLAQIGFAVAIGIFLSTFVNAWLLIPAITALLGRAAFWPAKAGRRRRTTGGTGTGAATTVPDGRYEPEMIYR